MSFEKMTVSLLVCIVLTVVSALEPETPRYEEVGCFLDNGNRPLPELLRNFRPQINKDWTNLNQIIQLCANLAEQKGYNYFAIQFWAECWSGPNAGQTYNKYGPSKDCAVGVGKANSNFVYRFKPKTTTLPPPSPTTIPETTAPPLPQTTIPDECKNYKELNSADRSVNQGPVPLGSPQKCDRNLVPAWYRFTGAAGNHMATTCVSQNRCGTYLPGWMMGELPTLAQGKVARTVCFKWGGDCCGKRIGISVLNCDGYFIYNLKSLSGLGCMRYCGNGVVSAK